MASSGFQRIATVSLVDECYQQIKEQLLSGSFSPGEPVRDSVLAVEMGVSRSPVREALRLLEQSGMLIKSANRSYRVADLTEHDADELAALRLADEGVAIRAIVKARTPIASLRPLIDAIRDAPEGSAEAAARDADFHSAVVQLAALPRLSKRFEDLSDQVRLMLMTSNSPLVKPHDQIWRSHVILFDALETSISEGDPATALLAWEAHITHSSNGPLAQKPGRERESG